MNQSTRMGRQSEGYEVVVVDDLRLAGVLLVIATLHVLFTLALNARYQARIWGYVEELEREVVDSNRDLEPP